MPVIHFVEPDGTEHHVAAAEGTSVMQAAVNNGVPGIDGDCGGLCACGTCHVYVEPNWQAAFDPPDELEQGILEFAYEVEASSRLGCQLIVDDTKDGIVVRLPNRQY